MELKKGLVEIKNGPGGIEKGPDGIGKGPDGIGKKGLQKLKTGPLNQEGEKSQ